MFIDFTSATGAVGPRLISKGGKMVPCQRLQGLRSVNFNQRVRWFTKILKECLRHCGMVVLDHVVIWLLCILGAWPYLGQAGESKQLMIGCFPCLLNVSEDRPNHLKAYLFHRETSCSLNCFSPLVHSLRLNGLLPKTVAAWNGKWKVVVPNMWRFPTHLACLGHFFLSLACFHQAQPDVQASISGLLCVKYQKHAIGAKQHQKKKQNCPLISWQIWTLNIQSIVALDVSIYI